MDFNLQISNWLLSALGGLASGVVVAAAVLLALNVFFRVRLLRSRGENLHWLLDRSLVIRFLCLLFFIWVLLGFNSNAPKVILNPDYSAEEAARERTLQAESKSVESIAPRRETAEETSAHLQSLRDKQKQAVLPDKR